MKRSEKYGERAWKDCAKFRMIAAIFMFLGSANMILWIFVPIPAVNWKISSGIWPGIITGIIICVVFMPFMILGEKDAGSETMKPSKETKMYGGIYKYIRHPQTLGEWPLLVALGAFVNSWFLILLSVLYIVIYTPIMIHYEELDLIRRFGEPYEEYRKSTGALFPKLRKKTPKNV